jgi:phospholipid/cholesterol/gamma-HCH transport system substrate-binding protein
MYKRSIAMSVGIFIIIVIFCLIFLALRVSGLSLSGGGLFSENFYNLSANFDSIGNLKVRAPVRLAGVVVGQVNKIELNKDTYQAKVTMKINYNIDNIPTDSSVSITSMGLLGDNYISISPGYNQSFLKSGSEFSVTYSATSISSLISTFISGSGGKNKSSGDDNNSSNNSGAVGVSTNNIKKIN